MDCLFCKIAAKEIPSEMIFETEDEFVFLDIHPLSQGHTIVIPKFHAETILEVPEDKMAALWNTVKKAVFFISTAIKPEGFTIGINHGKVSGQAIDHLHIHIIPRWKNDGGTSLHGIVRNSPDEAISETADRIRKAI